MKHPTLVICFSNNQGGMELNSMDIAQLLKPSAPVFFACRKHSFLDSQSDKLLQVGIPTLSIPFKGNFSLKCILMLRKFIQQHHIKNILFFGASELKSIIPATWGSDVNILNFHGTTKTHSKKDPLHRFIYKHIGCHIAVSEHIKKNVLNIIPCTSDKNVKVIYLPYMGDGTLNEPTEDRKTRFIHVGRISHGKGHKEAITTLLHLLKGGLNVSIDFVGSTESEDLKQELLAQIQGTPQHHSQFRFLGFRKDVAHLLSNTQFMLFPSAGEGLPNVIIEAFFNGNIPICYANTVFPEFQSMGFFIYLAENNNSGDLLAQTQKALSLPLPQIQSIISHNKTLAQQCFSPAKIRSDYTDLLI